MGKRSIKERASIKEKAKSATKPQSKTDKEIVADERPGYLDGKIETAGDLYMFARALEEGVRTPYLDKVREGGDKLYEEIMHEVELEREKNDAISEIAQPQPSKII